MRPAESALLHFCDELRLSIIAVDDESAVLDAGLAVCSECANKHEAAGVLADVDEAAGASQPATEPADIDVALAVALGHPQEGEARFTTLFGLSSSAARRAITLRSVSGSGASDCIGTRSSPLYAGS